MITKIREKVVKLMKGKSSPEQLMNELGIDKQTINECIKQILLQGEQMQDSESIEDGIYLLFAYENYSSSFVDILNKLMLCEWHKEHENIAMLLQRLKSPKSIGVLYETANKQFKYLEYDEFFALAVKCIWGLGDIGTLESYIKLETLSKSENEIIKENALKQMSRIEKRRKKDNG